MSDEHNELVAEYFAIAKRGAPFNDARLARLRQDMTEADLMEVSAKLTAAAKAEFEEADELRTYKRQKFGP